MRAAVLNQFETEAVSAVATIRREIHDDTRAQYDATVVEILNGQEFDSVLLNGLLESLQITPADLARDIAAARLNLNDVGLIETEGQLRAEWDKLCEESGILKNRHASERRDFEQRHVRELGELTGRINANKSAREAVDKAKSRLNGKPASAWGVQAPSIYSKSLETPSVPVAHFSN
jgi:hypothetical protein